MALTRPVLILGAILLLMVACDTSGGVATPPSAPTDLVATRGDASLAIGFSLVSDGGSPLTAIEYTFDGGASWVSSSTTTSPILLTGLTNGRPYTVRLRATNAVGSSPMSNAVTATPDPAIRVPDAPTDLLATPGDASLAIAFSVGNDGGSPITSLEYTLDEGATWSAAATSTSPLFLSGLLNGQPYTVRLRATNAVGTSPSSNPISGTPSAAHWLYATSGGGPSIDSARGVSALADGSAIVIGDFWETARFGAITITSAGGEDVFVGKVAPDGTWLWASSAGDRGINVPRGVDTLSDGSAIITGFFNIGSSFGDIHLTSAGSTDVFVAKIDSGGDWVWANRAGGEFTETASGVSVLSDGSAIVIGGFEGIASFGSTTLTSVGDSDVYLAKVDADGEWVWATSVGGVGLDWVFGASTLDDGSAVIAGGFQGSITFGSTTLTSADGPEFFVAKANQQGEWIWANSAGGGANVSGRSVSTLADGSAMIVGSFRGSAAFGSTTLIGAGETDDVFVANVDPDGDWVWAVQGSAGSGAVGAGVSVIADGSAIVTGPFWDSVTFGGTTLLSAGNRDVFVAKVDSDGNWVGATSAGSTNMDVPTGVSAFGDGSVLVVGEFVGTTTFGGRTLTSAGNRDMFVAKLNASSAW